MVNYLDLEVTKWFELTLVYSMDTPGMTTLKKKGEAAREQERDRGKEKENSFGEGNECSGLLILTKAK